LLTEDETKLKGLDEISNMLKTQGGMNEPKTDDIVVSCETGTTACLVEASLRALGNDKVKVYDGSMQEWRQYLKETD